MESAAPLIGGFADPAFLDILHGHDPLGDWHWVENDDAYVPAVVGSDGITFAGHEDLVDYRSTLGRGAVQALAGLLRDRSDLLLRVDSLPDEAAAVVEEAARLAGRAPERTEHETTARLDVAEGFDAYLAGISKKERHELRRKRRRYEEELGRAGLDREETPGSMFDAFVELHRAASGDKGMFMTDPMAEFFRAVLGLPGWHVDALVTEHGHVTAAAFAFEDDDAYYLYNSGYEPGLRHVSPGIVMLGLLIEQAADSPRHVFDFLKGDEIYKYRLGAQARQLYSVTA